MMTKSIILSIFVINSILLFVSPLKGIDVSKAFSITAWRALLLSYPGTEFAIVRIFNYNGTLDYNAPRTIRSAYTAGTTDISLYMYPCLTDSFYAYQNNIQCGTAAEQIAKIKRALTVYDIDFNENLQLSPTAMPSLNPIPMPSELPTQSPTNPTAKPTLLPTMEPTLVIEQSDKPTLSPTASSNPTYVPSSSPSYNRATNVKVQRLFITVEDEAPLRFFTKNSSLNLQYLVDLSVAAMDAGIAIGIYTTKKDWENIIEDAREDLTNPLSRYPLWVPRFDQTSNMNFFKPFGGWTSIGIKQVSGGSKEIRRVGSDRICENFKE